MENVWRAHGRHQVRSDECGQSGNSHACHGRANAFDFTGLWSTCGLPGASILSLSKDDLGGSFDKLRLCQVAGTCTPTPVPV
jgi:hypothetical protein